VSGSRLSGYAGVANRGNFAGLSNVGGNLATHGAAWGPHSPYWGYHQGWVRGYWNGQNNAMWSWRNPYWSGWGFGVGPWLGWGLAPWGFGSALYGMGYMPFNNPYYSSQTVVATQPSAAAVFDYSRPIDTVSPPVATSVSDDAMKTLDEARELFKQGNYADALQRADTALAKIPNDAAVHEFRALCLFALNRYDDAAATLYSVLAVGPGWDWATLSSLYPNVDEYTSQLRALEKFCKDNPDSASARFVLAYQYLTEGHNEAAASTLKKVVALKPDDSLSAKLLRQLSPEEKTAAAPSPPTPATAESAVPQGASISGNWTAKPTPDTSINLNIKTDGGFNWQVNHGKQTQDFAGTSSFADGVLTLKQEKGPTLVGRVNWKDATHMNFHVVGDNPEDPGLTFSK
jgi:tetratricopeptide (TPR) repeat protein